MAIDPIAALNVSVQRAHDSGEMRRWRVYIKPSAYRGAAGFLVYGSADRHSRVRIFTKTRASAEHIRGKIKRGEEIVPADFDVE